MKCFLQALQQLKRGSEVVALTEICFEGMRAVKKEFRGGGSE